MSAWLTMDASITAPEAELNTVNAGQPFATVTLSADGHTVLVFHTPGEARELAAAVEHAAVLLEKHAAALAGAS